MRVYRDRDRVYLESKSLSDSSHLFIRITPDQYHLVGGVINFWQSHCIRCDIARITTTNKVKISTCTTKERYNTLSTTSQTSQNATVHTYYSRAIIPEKLSGESNPNYKLLLYFYSIRFADNRSSKLPNQTNNNLS